MPARLPLPLLRLLYLGCALALLLLAFGVRVHRLGEQSLWNDEGNSYVQATRTLSEIAAHAARDIHPPGYYVLLAGWRLALGETEFALRLLSVFASLGSVAFTLALGRRLYGAPVGLVAALFVALNTFSITYAQEARMYALLALWGAAGWWALVNWFTTRQPRWAVVLALLNAAGLWTQYAYAFVMLAQGVLMLVWAAHVRPPRERLRLFGVCVVLNLATLLLYAPWLPAALPQVTTWQQVTTPTALDQALAVVLNWLTFGVTYVYTDSGSLAVALFLLVFGALRVTRPHVWRSYLPALWTLVMLGAFFAFDLFRIGNIKLLIPAQIALALWLARGASVVWDYRLRRRWVFRLAAGAGVAFIVFNLAFALAPLYTDPAYRRADYRGLVASISPDLSAGDAIILDAPNQAEVFGYYYRGDAPVYALPPGLGGDDAATRAAVRDVIGAHRRVFVVFWGEAERDPNRVVETTLDAESYEVGDEWYGDVRLARYVMPAPVAAEPQPSGARFGGHITLVSAALSARQLRPGDVVQVRLIWQTDAPLADRYKVFVQLLDRGGVLVAQRDSEPGGGLALTTTWQPDTPVDDLHGLLIPPDLPAGSYSLIVGMYTLDAPYARLPVADGDHLRLAQLTIDR